MNQLALPGKERIEFLREVMEESIARGLIGTAEAPVDHYHAEGLYGRRVYVPAKSTVVTKVHLSQHITVALKGTCTVYDATGKRTTVHSPNVFVTEPGTLRAIYCHDDVEWLTVHACSLKKVSEIENILFCDKYKEVDDKIDYINFLSEIGINENIARLVSENEEDQINDQIGCENIYISESVIQGNGVFAIKDFQPEEIIGIARIDDSRTSIGRYTNHNKYPNCKFEICDNLVYAIALKDIKKDTEITVNYRNAFDVANKLRVLS